MEVLDFMWENFYIFLPLIVLIINMPCRKNLTLRYFLKFGVFVLISAFFATIFIPFMIFRPRSWRNAIWPAAGLRLIKRVFRLNWSVRGEEHIVKNSGAVVLINHQSILDLLVLAELWKCMENCTVISKKEVLYLGPFGLAAWLWGTIFIDRLNPDQAKGTINRTGETVRQRQAKLLMFPEGTRNGGEGLLPFKKGAFHVAVVSRLPIQPVIVSKYYYVNHEKRRFGQGDTVIDILPPIETDGYTRNNIEELIDRTYQIMARRYSELNAEVVPIRWGNETFKFFEIKNRGST